MGDVASYHLKIECSACHCLDYLDTATFIKKQITDNTGTTWESLGWFFFFVFNVLDTEAEP